MDIIRATVAFRDRGLLDVFDLVVRFTAQNWKKLGIVCVVSFVPGFLLCLWGRDIFEPFALWPLALLFAVLGEVPLVALASKLVFDPNATVREALSIGLRTMPRILGVRVLQGLAVSASSIAIVIPFWVQGVLLFAPEAALLERASPLQACSRSQKLANRSTGESVLGALLLVIVQVASVPLGDHIGRMAMTELFDATPPPSVWDDASSAFALAGFFVAAPFVALLRFFLYLNVRTRVEGWDVQTRFVAIAQRAGIQEAAE
jgi:hypothetical protein